MAEIWLVVGEGAPHERLVLVPPRLRIGRECRGIEEHSRLLLDDPLVSRDHCEVLVEGDRAVLVDHSSNGTRINGRRLERGERSPLTDADLIEMGGTALRVRYSSGAGDPAPAWAEYAATRLDSGTTSAAILVGDIVGYTTLTEAQGGAAIAAASDELFGALRELVIAHGGTVSNYAGDAILSAWDLGAGAQAAADAVRCALASEEATRRIAPRLAVRDAAGEPMRMGWAVTSGAVATGRPSPSRDAVVGDPVILAFRLAGLAGRAGLPEVLVTREAAALAGAVPGTRYDEPLELEVKGRAAVATVLPAAFS